jgi:hypothetical protein
MNAGDWRDCDMLQQKIALNLKTFLDGLTAPPEINVTPRGTRSTRASTSVDTRQRQLQQSKKREKKTSLKNLALRASIKVSNADLRASIGEQDGVPDSAGRE